MLNRHTLITFTY